VTGVARARRAAAALLVVIATACSSARGSEPARPTKVRYGTPAADFSLRDQFGRPERLSDFRGRVVLLTFIDARCTDLCPLTADLLRRAEESMDGDPQVQVVAIDANPDATAVADVRRWSVRHRMLHRWLFLTAPVGRLRRVWSDYGIAVRVHGGEVAHTSVIFLIDGTGRERGVFPIAAKAGIPAEVDALVTAVGRM
jgi:cytochrome oxidase Cu insertion factor (SCO1/SenC/PrrC family)